MLITTMRYDAMRCNMLVSVYLKTFRHDAVATRLYLLPPSLSSAFPLPMFLTQHIPPCHRSSQDLTIGAPAQIFPLNRFCIIARPVRYAVL